MSGPIYAVVNPASGSAGSAEALRNARALAGRDVTWLETTPDDPGTGQTREAITGRAGTIIVLGGDGTVRAAAAEAAGSGVPLTVVPTGTGNLLAANLRLPDDPFDAIGLAVSGQDRTLDLGYVNGEAFTVMAGTGVDAAMIGDTSPRVKRWLGKLAYVNSAVKHLRDARFTATVEVDGERVFSGHVATVVVGNMGQVMSGVDLFPSGAPDDGALDVAVVRCDSLWDWVRLGARVVFRRHHRSDAIDMFSGREVVVRLERPRPYQVDGEERAPAADLRFHVEPGALVVRVPG